MRESVAEVSDGLDALADRMDRIEGWWSHRHEDFRGELEELRRDLWRLQDRVGKLEAIR